MLASLLLSADLAPWELSEIEQRNLLTVFVQQRRSQGRRVVLVIDDAHTFKPAALEEIERLVCIQGRQEAGARARARRARRRSRKHGERARAALDVERGAACTTSTPPSQDDSWATSTGAWRASRCSDFMTPVATQMIARLSGGRYAAADVLCQMSLLAAAAVEPGARGRARGAASGRDARRAPRRQARSGDPADGDRARSTHRRRGICSISRGGKVLTRITLGQRTLIGRSEHNDVCLPSPYLSRHHAVIVGTPEGYYVVDLNSVNGAICERPQGRARGALRRGRADDRSVPAQGPGPGMARARQSAARRRTRSPTRLCMPPQGPPAPSPIRAVK